MEQKVRIAILDDYQNVTKDFADWSVLPDTADIVVFNDHITDQQVLTERLLPFDIICVMRERTPLTGELLAALTNLKLIVSTGKRNASIDAKAVKELNIELKHTGYVWSGAPELTWALLMAIARKIPQENRSFIEGRWQTSIGTDLSGKTIGIVGLGNIGSKMAAYAKVFDMKVIAWSENLTAEKAAAAGAVLVSKETLFREADFVTIHLVLSDRSRGIVTADDLSQMKPSAYLINTSRGPLIDEQALIAVLQQRSIAGAALDVFNEEPLRADHPLRSLDNVLATPHIGYVTEDTYSVFYKDIVKAIQEWMTTFQ
jgi:phosphoglycerate dehydrogenase-like enzyme